jgi:hypothetical protein
MIDNTQPMLKEDWFWTMMQFFVVAATLILIYIQVKIQTAAHVVQALSTIHNRWNSETMLRARLKVCSDWIAGKKEFDGVDQYIAEFIEELGIYVQTGAIPANAMWEAQSWYIDHYYCMFKDGIEHVRKDYKDINLYSQFESLYKKMEEISRRNNSPAFIREGEELKRFADNEIQLSKAFLQLREET